MREKVPFGVIQIPTGVKSAVANEESLAVPGGLWGAGAEPGKGGSKGLWGVKAARTKGRQARWGRGGRPAQAHLIKALPKSGALKAQLAR